MEKCSITKVSSIKKSRGFYPLCITDCDTRQRTDVTTTSYYGNVVPVPRVSIHWTAKSQQMMHNGKHFPSFPDINIKITKTLGVCAPVNMISVIYIYKKNIIVSTTKDIQDWIIVYTVI